MNRSFGCAMGRVAAGATVALLGAIASFAGADDAADEPTKDEVNEKARDVDRNVRDAEEALARSLRPAARRDDAAHAEDAAAASLAELLRRVHDDGRRASAAMQWLMDNAPQ